MFITECGRPILVNLGNNKTIMMYLISGPNLAFSFSFRTNSLNLPFSRLHNSQVVIFIVKKIYRYLRPKN